MSAVFNSDLPCFQKMVLLIIADRSNDEGEGCFYSVSTIAEKAGMSPRAVQAQISKLESEGYLTRQDRAGRSCHWYIDPRSCCTPNSARTPAAAAGGGASPAPYTSLIPTPLEANASPPTAAPQPIGPQQKPVSGDRAKPLPDAWRPEPLPDELAAAVRVMPGTWYQRQLDAMRAEARRKGKAGWQRDWQACWVRRISRALDLAGRTPAPEAGSSATGELLPAGLPGGLSAFVEALRLAIGTANYRAWFSDCDFGIDGDRAVVEVASTFKRSYIEENFGRALRVAAEGCNFIGVALVLGEARPGDRAKAAPCVAEGVR